MNLLQCMMTHSSCYNQKEQLVQHKGIVVHDTAAGNQYIKRYVQPYETDDKYDELIKVLGKNKYNNDWNHKELTAGVHAFIGKLADNSIATCECLPYSKCAWGVGKGCNGSFNYNPTAHIQFEICDDGYKSKEYFLAVMKEAQEYCAYLCNRFKFNPLTDIVSHQEAYKLGYGSDHSDIDKWLSIFGYTMDWFRKCVDELVAKSKKRVVLVTYVNEVGEEMAPSDTLTGDLGQEYKVTPPQIKGFETNLKNFTSTFTENDSIVVTYYRINYTLKINYQDEKGNVLKEGTTYQIPYKDLYDFDVPDIKGYTTKTKHIVGQSLQDKVVTVIYTEDKKEDTVMEDKLFYRIISKMFRSKISCVVNHLWLLLFGIDNTVVSFEDKYYCQLNYSFSSIKKAEEFLSELKDKSKTINRFIFHIIVDEDIQR